MAIGTTAAILGSAALGAAGSAIGSNAQSKAAGKAANASQQASDATIAEQRRQFDIGQQNQQPWLTTGTGALNQLASLYGLPSSQLGGGASGGQFNAQGYLAANPDVAAAVGSGSFGGDPYAHWQEYGQSEGRTGGFAAPAQAGDAAPTGMAAFVASPDYQFRQNESMRALTARNAALGIQDSGAAQRSALQLSGNLASGEFNNYANRLSSLAGVGQTAAQNTAAAGQNFANSMGQVLGNNAQNLASSYGQQGAASANMWGNLAGIGSGVLGQFGGSAFDPKSAARAAKGF